MLNERKKEEFWTHHLGRERLFYGSPQTQSKLKEVNQQIDELDKALRKVSDQSQTISGLGIGPDTSKALSTIGVPGHKYLDATSRGSQANQNYNYVVYPTQDPEMIKIMNPPVFWTNMAEKPWYDFSDLPTWDTSLDPNLAGTVKQGLLDLAKDITPVLSPYRSAIRSSQEFERAKESAQRVTTSMLSQQDYGPVLRVLM